MTDKVCADALASGVKVSNSDQLATSSKCNLADQSDSLGGLCCFFVAKIDSSVGH
ncbi:hypothetical protein [Moraxella marmotae]